ncbi:MAG TPA: magnesium-translocating P-type ATPase [Steroidobacteraceae bacterium]|nr:magnesium-translocating P-type ATPase [Steroidobacteraceae bacterium]
MRSREPVRPSSAGQWWAAGVEPSATRGLSSAEAARRLREWGPNELRSAHAVSHIRVLWNQLRSPLLLLLILASAASALSGAWTDAGIVLLIVVASTGVGYTRELRAQLTAERLRARVQARAWVLRDGAAANVPVREVVRGDVFRLSAGSLVPADALVLESIDCFVNESALTGESFPALKQPGLLPASTPPAQRSNSVFLGTSVRSGTALCLAMDTGTATRFGAIAHHLTLPVPETDFDRGVRHFGYLLATTMFIMVLVVFAANMLLDREPVQTLLFAIALAVGLSPELLPAILNVNLARGAQSLARRGVLVRRLNAIENLGSMDVLCTDKTGTLTEGVIELEEACDAQGNHSSTILQLAACNAGLQSGVANPLDEAILRAWQPAPLPGTKLGEIPYDFTRRRLSVAVGTPEGPVLVTKGAFLQVLEVCTHTSDGALLDEAGRAALQARFDAWSSTGRRVLAVATRPLDAAGPVGRGDESGMRYAGFLVFLDRPKAGVAGVIIDLHNLGVAVKLITGDNRQVARHLAAAVGLEADRLLTGPQLDPLHDAALWQAVRDTAVFAEIDPNQKERIVLALKKNGHVVGFLGDGINDAPAMRAADTSLSVADAADVAREAADFVLMEQDLAVIRGGIEAGRITFANTLKYVLATTSANLGNMVSMAIASLFLPFLPLLAGQILLNNFLSDIPAIGLADDRVDPERVRTPQRWDMVFVRRFMIRFGLVSSLFDLVTFALLLGLFGAGVELFRTGWFVESLLSELLVVVVVRTQRPVWASRPGGLLLGLTAAVCAIAIALPYLPFAALFGFTAMPAPLLLSLLAISALYVAATEVAKRPFYRTRPPDARAAGN